MDVPCSIVFQTRACSLSNKANIILCLIFLPILSIFFLILFFELDCWTSKATVVSQFSSHPRPAGWLLSIKEVMVVEGLGPRVSNSNGLYSLTLGPVLLSWVSPLKFPCALVWPGPFLS